MSVRSHTTEARQVHASAYNEVTDPVFLDSVGFSDDDWLGDSPQVLTLLDGLNGEALVLLGTRQEFIDLAASIIVAANALDHLDGTRPFGSRKDTAT